MKKEVAIIATLMRFKNILPLTLFRAFAKK
jgi:hypothetical protein